MSNKKSGSTVLSDFSMTGAGHYDGAGNLLSLTASLPGAPGSYSGTTSLQYDSHDQLNREQSGRLGSYTNTFAFDGAGNPTTFKGATQTFNSANQNNAFTYDGDGNPKTWQSSNLTFDAGNHLTAIGTTLTAGYNAEGLRAWKQSASGTTYFLYDGLTPIVELDANANVLAVNTWGAKGLLSRRTVSTNSSVFYTFDEQGSTAQRLDSNGNILGSYGFDAFGTRASTDNSSDPYSGFGAQFGYYRDSEIFTIKEGNIAMSAMESTRDNGRWLVLCNQRNVEQWLILEPWAIRWKMQPGERYFVYLQEAPTPLPEIYYYEETVQVFAAEAVI